MSNKRVAGSELNADNWDQVDEVEEIGTFRVASNEELEKRVVRTAKRRSNLTSYPSSNDEVKYSLILYITQCDILILTMSNHSIKKRRQIIRFFLTKSL